MYVKKNNIHETKNPAFTILFMSLNVHEFAAIRGKQSGDDYFTVVCEMALIPKLFLFNSLLFQPNFAHKDILTKAVSPKWQDILLIIQKIISFRL